jgi:alpha-tubulin suppressor-like RCC1 family protein
MEILLVITVILFAIGHVFEKATNFFKQLKSGSAKLSKGFEAKLSFVPIHSKKSEVSDTDTNSTNDNLD